MEIFSLAVGFVIGVIVVSIAIETGTKKTSRATPASRPTKKWDPSEIANPRIIAEYLSDVELPKNSKIVVNKYKDKKMLAGLDVKKHSGIKGNFIIGDDRVLVLSGPLKKNELGIWTVEKEIVEQLNNEFEQMWNEGTRMTFDERDK